jgi:hypothetical protein
LGFAASELLEPALRGRVTLVQEALDSGTMVSGEYPFPISHYPLKEEFTKFGGGE